MKKLYCYGKKDFCEVSENCSETCPHYDGTGVCDIDVPPTNADRIRAMTDEELLGFLMQVQDATINRFAKFELPNYNALADWLQMPAGEEDKHGAD